MESAGLVEKALEDVMKGVAELRSDWHLRKLDMGVNGFESVTFESRHCDLGVHGVFHF